VTQFQLMQVVVLAKHLQVEAVVVVGEWTILWSNNNIMYIFAGTDVAAEIAGGENSWSWHMVAVKVVDVGSS
jgi:hypothetical protein